MPTQYQLMHVDENNFLGSFPHSLITLTAVSLSFHSDIYLHIGHTPVACPVSDTMA